MNSFDVGILGYPTHGFNEFPTANSNTYYSKEIDFYHSRLYRIALYFLLIITKIGTRNCLCWGVKIRV